DVDTVTVNVLAFMKTAQVATRHFLRRGRGHLVGISSIAALRGNCAGADYAASKAFQSVYLDGLRDLARQSGLPIAVTEVQPGAVDTAMLKTERPLPSLVKWLFVSSPAIQPSKSSGQFENGRSVLTLRGDMRWSLSYSSCYREPVERTAAAAPIQ